MTSYKRIAICGFNLESNRFAPTCSRNDFEENMYLVGDRISQEARTHNSSIHLGIKGFYSWMDRVSKSCGGWSDKPTLLLGSTPAGPVQEHFFKEFLHNLETMLRAIGIVDGVYICQHGAAVATHTHDPDGDMFKLIRQIIGPAIPIIATLDLHANISEEMMDATDMLIAYRTNPHIDLFERGEEAAKCMLEMFDGVRPKKHRIRLPLVAPSVTQLTAVGHPYGDLIRFGQTFIDSDIINVSILSGFAFSDTPKNGMTIITHSRESIENAKQVSIKLAKLAWEDKDRYRSNMTELSEAVSLAKVVGDNEALEAILFADPADNPGGGGRGNTTYILKALLDAGVDGCVLAVFYDKSAVQAAFSSGMGSTIKIILNETEKNEFSEPLAVIARVVSLHSGKFKARYGMVAGTMVDTGPTAVLDLGGVVIICISKRQQCRSSDYLSAFGINPLKCRSIVVKSRGHFRAGFQHLFPPERIIEIDSPGLTSPNLANFNWKNLPRPVFPLDPETVWNTDTI